MVSVDAFASRPRVKLDQGTVVGIDIKRTYPDTIEAFLGVPYALPPVGELRFRASVKVPTNPSSTVLDASKFGPAAPGKALLAGGPVLEQSEDCLTANIFRPKLTGDNIKLPVAIYIHGGAFNRGSASMHDTASMVAWSEAPFIGVSFGYRVGALGFLPSTLSKKEGILNLGLRDQILLFEWVRDNIAHFGGDSNNITLFGLSAGAHSIGHHLMNFDQSKQPLFHRVILESGAPTSRAVRPHDAEIHERQFQDFLQAVGCPKDLPESAIFPYLRSLPSKVVTDAQTKVFDKYNPSLRWAFQPVIDDEIIARRPLDAWQSGRWNKVPILTGFNENEASMYVDKAMSTSAQFREFWQNLLPGLSEGDLDTIERLYSDPSTNPRSPYVETRKEVGAQFARNEAAYGHYAYVAPARQTAHFAASQGVSVYLYHWALIRTRMNRANHGDNMYYETFNDEITKLSDAQRELSGTLHAYITSFIAKGDPNAIAGRYANRPRWERYDSEKQLTMIFGKGNEELVGGGQGKTAQCVKDDWAIEQTSFWWSKVPVSQRG